MSIRLFFYRMSISLLFYRIDTLVFLSTKCKLNKIRLFFTFTQQNFLFKFITKSLSPRIQNKITFDNSAIKFLFFEQILPKFCAMNKIAVLHDAINFVEKITLNLTKLNLLNQGFFHENYINKRNCRCDHIFRINCGCTMFIQSIF